MFIYQLVNTFIIPHVPRQDALEQGDALLLLPARRLQVALDNISS